MRDRDEAPPPVLGESVVVRRFPAHPSALHAIREFVCDQAVEAALPTEVAIDLALAVSEAGSISVCQTNSSSIEVAWRSEADRVEISLTDDGVYFADASLRRPESMGIALIKALVDDFDFREGTELSPGSHLRLVKLRSAGL
ncbi:MAG TPA: ATP-binding protein [Actinomycetota bacterium]|nr:ATP-binding protein [Actinomycetota bacterium]